MKFFGAFAVHILMGSVLAAGIVLAANGKFWLLILGAFGYLFGLIKYGCNAH